MIAGATPMRTSVNANVTSGCTTTRSHDAISPMPPARTGPSTAAIVGAARSIEPFERVAMASSRPCPAPRSFRSAPAQKTGGACASAR